MNGYNRNNRPGGRRHGGGNFRSRDVRREMYKAVCDECGKNCEVPFKPSGDKPVYCSSCFEERGGGDSRMSSQRSSGRSNYEKRDNLSKQLLEQVSSLNAKVDRILQVLESNNEKKPVLKKIEVKKTAKKETTEDKETKKKRTSGKKTKKSTTKV